MSHQNDPKAAQAVGVGGQPFQFNIVLQPPADAKSVGVSVVVPFDAVRHLLSDKPLRRAEPKPQ